MSGWWVLVAAVGAAWAVLVAVLVFQWQQAEARRMDGYRDWIEGKRLP